LPVLRIKRSHISSKIIDEKDPPTANLGTGNDARLGSTTQFLGMTTEKIGGLAQT